MQGENSGRRDDQGWREERSEGRERKVKGEWKAGIIG